jgi:peroxiredoxin
MKDPAPTVAAEPPLEISAPGQIPPPLLPGDPAPWFVARSDVNQTFRFASLGGRHVLMCFLPSFTAFKTVHDRLLEASAPFPQFVSALILVSASAADEGASVPSTAPMARYFFDADRRIAAAFGVEAATGPRTFVIDERLRVFAAIDDADPAQHVARALAAMAALGPLPEPRAATPHAPVLIVPRVFELGLCQALIAGYERDGGHDSGFMVERGGRTVLHFDYAHKRRADWTIDDQALVKACHTRLRRRLVPEIRRAFQFEVTRIERNLVACYTAEDGGHFNRHRDNTTKGTAHRRFAVSVNLNAEDYDGGDLVFPEFGLAHFRPPTGGACVFSCSLLHEATRVTRGRRFVFVPFLYDESAAQVRQANLSYIGEEPNA